MKIQFAGVLAVVVLGAAGCDRGTPGGAGVTAPAAPADAAKPVATTARRPNPSEADNSFSLKMPFRTMKVTHGEEQVLVIGINRGPNFGESVGISLAGLPAGVSQVTANSTIDRDSTETQILLKVAEDATLGDFSVKVTGHTTSSEVDATNEFIMTVAQKQQ